MCMVGEHYTTLTVTDSVNVYHNNVVSVESLSRRSPAIWTFLFQQSFLDIVSCPFFTALHGMQTRSSDENYVCPSVTRVHCDKTEERSVQIFIPCERSFRLVFFEEEWLVGGDPFYLKFWVNRPHWREIADFEPIFVRRASVVTSNNKMLSYRRETALQGVL